VILNGRVGETQQFVAISVAVSLPHPLRAVSHAPLVTAAAPSIAVIRRSGVRSAHALQPARRFPGPAKAHVSQPGEVVNMLWFFERQGARLLYEIRREGNGSGYELVVCYADGTREVERFDDSAALLRRSEELQRGLVQDGWRQQQPQGS
jgi:hypothetical protein